MAETPERCAVCGGFPTWLFITESANHRVQARQRLDMLLGKLKEMRDRRVIESLSSL